MIKTRGEHIASLGEGSDARLAVLIDQACAEAIAEERASTAKAQAEILSEYVLSHTFRRDLAANILSDFLSIRRSIPDPSKVGRFAREAVALADSLIAELDKPKELK